MRKCGDRLNPHLRATCQKFRRGYPVEALIDKLDECAAMVSSVKCTLISLGMTIIRRKSRCLRHSRMGS